MDGQNFFSRSGCAGIRCRPRAVVTGDRHRERRNSGAAGCVRGETVPQEVAVPFAHVQTWSNTGYKPGLNTFG